ncbi:hypothetical protein ACTA71_012538 [Dictyostelium dimigraforme]
MDTIIETFNYDNDSKEANSNPVSFWDKVAKNFVQWDKMYDQVYSGNEMYPDWFKGGQLNTCYNVVDIHFKNPIKRDQVAIICEYPYLKKTVKLTYYQLYEKVCEFSRVLLNLNVNKNDNVIIYMANTIEAIIAMLSCSRIGATHCILFDGYSVKSLIDRIETITPKLIITSNYGILNDEITEFTPNLKKAIELSTFKPNYIITHFRNYKDEEILTTEEKEHIESIEMVPNTLDWRKEINKIKENNQSPFYEYVKVDSSHPLYIIYTSGTTGNSKGVVRSNGSHLVGLHYLWYSIFPSDENTVFFTHSPIGWLSFHSFSYASLSKGNTFVLMEGGIMKPKHMEDYIWSTVEKHKVNTFLSLGKTIRYLIKVDPDANTIHSKYNLSSLKSIWIGGEVVEESISEYVEKKIKCLSSVAYGQTEGGTLTLFDYKNSKKSLNTIGVPTPSIKPFIFSEDGKELATNEIGEIVLKLPVPPSFVTSFYKNEEQFQRVFNKFPGYYSTGDLGYKDDHGYYSIVARVDDQIKVGGNKVQLISIETSILKHPLILECCSIGIYSPDYFNVPIGLLVTKQVPFIDENNLKNEINNIISEDIDSIAKLRQIIIVPQIPKTKSGKIPRLIISRYLNDTNYQLPDNIGDITLFSQIKHLYLKLNK